RPSASAKRRLNFTGRANGRPPGWRLSASTMATAGWPAVASSAASSRSWSKSRAFSRTTIATKPMNTAVAIVPAAHHAMLLIAPASSWKDVGYPRNDAGHPDLDLHADALDLRGGAAELEALVAVLEGGQVQLHRGPLRVDAGIHLLAHSPQVGRGQHHGGARRRAAQEAASPECLLGAADRPAGRVDRHAGVGIDGKRLGHGLGERSVHRMGDRAGNGRILG